jgi:hypothetical protein
VGGTSAVSWSCHHGEHAFTWQTSRVPGIGQRVTLRRRGVEVDGHAAWTSGSTIGWRSQGSWEKLTSFSSEGTNLT